MGMHLLSDSCAESSGLPQWRRSSSAALTIKLLPSTGNWGSLQRKLTCPAGADSTVSSSAKSRVCMTMDNS